MSALLDDMLKASQDLHDFITELLHYFMQVNFLGWQIFLKA